MAFLAGDFVGGALLQKAAGSGVHALGIFPHDDEVDVVGSFVCQRRFDTRVQFHRPQVDVLVEFKPKPKENPLFQNSRAYVGMPDGAEIDRVELSQFVNRAVGQRFARPEVTVPAEIELHGFYAQVEFFGCCLKHLSSLHERLRGPYRPLE